MIQYNREILSLYVQPQNDALNNIVTRVTWRYRAKDEATFADVYKETYFTTTDPNNFIDYQNLTQDIVFEWIDAAEDLDSIKEEVTQRLIGAKNPSMLEKKIPWDYVGKYSGKEEYLIVFDDQPNDPEKIWGPMRWNSDRANDGLKKRGVHEYEFPTDVLMYQKELLPIDAPTVVNDRVKIYKVEYTIQPELNDLFQYHEGLTWVVDSGKAVGTYFVLDRPLEKTKEMMQNMLSNKSFQKQIGGMNLTLDGEIVKINTDLVSRVNLSQRWILMSDTDDIIRHKVNDTLWKEMNKDQAGELLRHIHDHITNVLNWEYDIFTQINFAKTVAELKAVEI
jgi:hypothetical protein